MSAWRKNPPTHDEWLAAKNHGSWWVKFPLCFESTEIIDGEEVTWPETWFTEVVTITCSYPDGLLKGTPRLHARGSIIKSIDLDDPKATKHLYWQPVAPPLDDMKDQRPEVD